jgi:exo-beta-1,3-glucanase (GH17 family)
MTSLELVTVSAVKPSAAPSSAPAPAGGIPTNGNKWAFTYTPYDANGGCLDAGTVATQVAAIAAKGFTTLRLYGTDCSTLSSVGPAARANGMKLILGIFIKSDGIAAAQSQVTDITAWGSAGNWDLVVMAVVGNEALQDGYCDAPSLAAFVTSCRAAFVGAGLPSTVPITTAEPVSSWGANTAALCPVVDVVGVNIETFFDGKVVAANAGSFVLQMFEQVANFCPGKPYYNLESGWPSSGGDNGASVASPEAQAAAMADIAAKAGNQTVMFSFQNDAWKPSGVDQFFGCLDLF